MQKENFFQCSTIEQADQPAGYGTYFYKTRLSKASNYLGI